jgi:uncharacterized protein
VKWGPAQSVFDTVTLDLDLGRGGWLDRGELDKIIERASEQMIPPAPAPAMPRRCRSTLPTTGTMTTRFYQSRGYEKKRKKRSFLQDMFDFD